MQQHDRPRGRGVRRAVVTAALMGLLGCEPLTEEAAEGPPVEALEAADLTPRLIGPRKADGPPRPCEEVNDAIRAIEGRVSTLAARARQIEEEGFALSRKLEVAGPEAGEEAERALAELRGELEAVHEELLALRGQLGALYQEHVELGEAACAPPPSFEPDPQAADALVRCVLDRDGDGRLALADYSEAAEMPLAACRAEGGAVRGGIEPVVPRQRPHRVRVVQASDLDRELARLIGRLMEWIRSLGIHQREYREGEYDCDDFADDLEQALERLVPGLGTFTYMACDWDAEKRNYTWAHAVTDVHLGRLIFWVEPQTGQIVSLDKDGDGRVGYVRDLRSYPTATDGGCFIAVFDSAADARAKGLVLD